MDLRPYVDNLRKELMVVAEAGGEEFRELAERILSPLDSAARLVLLDALSAAADEMTRDIAPVSVEVRLRGTDPGFVVTSPLAGRPLEDEPCENGLVNTANDSPSSAARVSAAPNNEGTTARINFRPPEQLKVRIEEAAGQEGLSVNAWLVRVVAATLDGRQSERRTVRSEQHYVGWVR